MDSAVAVTDELREDGFDVVIGYDVVDIYSAAAFAEVYKDSELAGDELQQWMQCCYERLDKLLDPVLGLCTEYGEIDADHVAFSD
jgi:hypothetical protein